MPEKPMRIILKNLKNEKGKNNMKICDKCFKDTDKELHQSWCPDKKKTMDMPEGFDQIFPGFTSKDDWYKRGTRSYDYRELFRD